MRYVDIRISRRKFIKKAMVVVSFETRTISTTKPKQYIEMINYNKCESKIVQWSMFKNSGKILLIISILLLKHFKGVAILENDKIEQMQGQSPTPWLNTIENNPFKVLNAEAEYTEQGISF